MNEENKTMYTKGPWVADIRGGCLAVYQKLRESEFNCLSSNSENVIHYSRKDAKFVENENGGWWEMSEQAIADAKLIAAAPDMYEALISVKKYFDNNNDIPKDLKIQVVQAVEGIFIK